MNIKQTLAPLLLGVALCAPIASAGEILVGYVPSANSLIRFDSSTPGTLTTVPIVGLGTDQLMGIDFRPANGLLYAFLTSGGLTGSLVTVDPFTGIMTTVAPGVSLPNGNFQGVDFNPVADRIRTVTSSNQSSRYDPVTGSVTVDTPPSYVGGDSNQGQTPHISNVAYTNNFAGAGTTTLFGIDSALDVLTIIGGPNGSPSPNGGLVTTIGLLGVNASDVGGFDISGATGALFAVITVSNATGLYTINPTTGAAAFAGLVGGGTSALNGLSVLPAAVPEPATWMMLGGGLVGLTLLRRRRR